jgi:hypothetical protein
MTVCSYSVVPIWNQIRRFSALEPSAQGLFLRASVLLPLISISFRLCGFRKTKALLENFLSAPDGSQNPARAALTAQMVRAAGRHGMGHPNCLKIALAIWWLLARQGIACDLRVGVRKDGEKFEAHAWIECGGVVLSDPESRHDYAAFDAALASFPREHR